MVLLKKGINPYILSRYSVLKKFNFLNILTQISQNRKILRCYTIELRRRHELMNSGTRQNDAQNLHSLRFVCKKHRIRKKICCLGICSQENPIKAHISLLTRLFMRHSSQMTNQAQHELQT